MIASLLTGVIYCAVVAIFIWTVRSHRFASPAFWLPIAMALIALPTFALLDMSHPSDVSHLLAFLVAVVSFVVPTAIYASYFDVGAALARYGSRSEEPDTTDAVAMATLLLLFSVGITILYFYLVGYNLFFLLLAGTVGDYSAMRLSAYSGDSYFAPGYVNQFKNCLYPILATASIIWLRRSRSRMIWPIAFVAIGFGVFALLGTGQRVYILFAIFTTLYGLYLLGLGRHKGFPVRLVVLLVVPAFLLFGFMTVAYKQMAGAGTGELVADISERFLRIQQEGGLIGFRYFADRGTVWFGEWIKGWVGILPGREGSMVAHEVHGEMYGSTQGTVPLTAVGSAYLNGGLAAVAILFSFLGLSYSYLYHRFLMGPRTVLRSLAYGALFFYLGTYVVGPPESLVDTGVVTVLLLLVLRRIRWLPSRIMWSSRQSPPVVSAG